MGNPRVVAILKAAMSDFLYLPVRICSRKGYSKRRKAPRDKDYPPILPYTRHSTSTKRVLRATDSGQTDVEQPTGA